MNLVLRGLYWKKVLAFLDDILVLGKNFQDYLDNIIEVLQRFRSYGLKLKPQKCILFRKEVDRISWSYSKQKWTQYWA